MSSLSQKLFLAGICTFAHVQAMEATFDSLTIQGVFSPADQQLIHNPIAGAKTSAQQAFYKHLSKPNTGDTTGNYIFFHKPSDYHFTACIIEPSKVTGTPLTASFHGNLLKDCATQNLQASYKANVYQFQFWVHGYDAVGNSIDKKYANSSDVTLATLNKDFPCGIVKADCVHRVGTSLKVQGQKTQNGPLRNDIEQKLTPDINCQKLLMSNPYEGKYDDLIGHLTAVTMKKQLKGKMTSASASFAPSEYMSLVKTYQALQTAWRANNSQVYHGQPLTIKFRISGRQIVGGKVTDTVLIPDTHK